MFPLLHTGRPWLAIYWLFPYPNTMGLWPPFRSPLIWDVFAVSTYGTVSGLFRYPAVVRGMRAGAALIWGGSAVSTYGTVSALFWYTGLVPDMATLRDRAKSPIAKKIYGMVALGWRGSAPARHPPGNAD